jgi:molybdate transport system substrate-binding protein
MRRLRGLVVLCAVVLLTVRVGDAAGGAPPGAGVLVFAAASLQDVLADLATAAQQATGVRTRVSFAASSALARQIENGAPAELFISADNDWMDHLASRRLVRPETRTNLAGNRLVLVAPADRRIALTIGPGFPLATALGGGRLALANPDIVPAGKYAKAALTALGVWKGVAPRVAPAENVRGALMLVARGEAPLGIVYATDALIDKGVAVVGTFPADTHPPIAYPAALTPDATPQAAAFLQFLRSSTARVIFVRHGFTADR